MSAPRLPDFVRATSWLLFTFSPVFLVIDSAFDNRVGVITDLIVWAGAGTALMLLKSGHRDAARRLLAVLAWLPAAVALQAVGGVASPFFGVHLVTLGMVSLLAGARGTLVAGAATLLMIWLPVPEGPRPSTDQYAATWSAVVAFVVIGLAYLVPKATEAVRRLASTVAQLETTTVSRDHLAGLLDALGEWILVTDPDGIVREVSGGRGRFPAGNEVVGQPITSLLLDRVTRGTTTRGRVRAADGSLVDVLITDGDLPQGRVWAITDVSELTRAHAALEASYERATAASDAKSSFLAQMSHELRTPLNAIIGYAELLEEEVDDPTAKPDLQRIERSAHHLLGLIDTVLDLSKIEAGAPTLTHDEEDLSALVDDVRDVIAPVAAHRGLDLHVRGHLDGPLITTDGQRLQQVLLNLLSNAVKFTDEGSVVLEVERWQRHRVPWLRFRVVDTGIGMGADELTHVFDPFQRGRATDREGTGLGLAICHAYVDQLGGQLLVRSTLGVGSTFTVEVPAVQVVAYGEMEPTEPTLKDPTSVVSDLPP